MCGRAQVRFRPTTGLSTAEADQRLLSQRWAWWKCDCWSQAQSGLLVIASQNVRITDPQAEAATQLTWLAYSDDGRPVRPVAIAR
jgi:hypothetical protein